MSTDTTNHESTIRLKMGQIEVEFKGSESFIKNELKDLVSTIAEVHKNVGFPLKPVDERLLPKNPQNLGLNADDLSEHTVTSIATKFGCKTTVDLITAAATHLIHVRKKPSFSRSELLTSMREATMFWKDSDARNLNARLVQLEKESVLRKHGNQFKFSPESNKDFEAKLAQ